MRDVELEGGARGVQAECEVGAVAGLGDGVVVLREVVRGGAEIVAGCVEGLGSEGGGVEDVELPSVGCEFGSGECVRRLTFRRCHGGCCTC